MECVCTSVRLFFVSLSRCNANDCDCRSARFEFPFNAHFWKTDSTQTHTEHETNDERRTSATIHKADDVRLPSARSIKSNIHDTQQIVFMDKILK